MEQGYRFALFDTLNRFYTAEEQDEVAARCPRERAPWDAVRHMYEIGRAPESPAHPDHALTRELARGFWASLPQLEARMLARLLASGRGLMVLYRPHFRHPEKAEKPPNLVEADKIEPGLTPVYADPTDPAVDVETPSGEVLSIDDPILIRKLEEG